MAKKLKPTVRGYLQDSNISKRYIRPAEAAEHYGVTENEVLELALAAGAKHQLPRTTLICQKRLEEFMKHLYKVPGTSKVVQKKYVRIGEGSIIYSIGKTRFMVLAKKAGAVYKVGNSALVNTELFEQYLEQFREPSRPLPKHTWIKLSQKENAPEIGAN